MSLWNLFEIAELIEVMQQCGDSNFIDLLSHVRIAEFNDSDVSWLRSKLNNNYYQDALHIFSENESAHMHNITMLNSIENHLYKIDAKDHIPKNISSTKIESVLKGNQSETGGLASTLQIKLNARVMLTMNVDRQDRLINDQLGTVKHIAINDQRNISNIYIKFGDNKAALKRISMDSLLVTMDRCLLKDPKLTSDLEQVKILSLLLTEVSLMLAWGCAVPKVQGLTLEKVVISFDLVKQRSFNYGQVYVALSRVTSLDNLYLIGSFTLSVIEADPRAIHEYQRLQNERQLPSSCTSVNSLKIALLNTRSLNKHRVEFSKGSRLQRTDILFLTETHVINTLPS